MAAPVKIICAEGQWTLVASSVVTGQVAPVINDARYVHTYRDAGDAAPTVFDEGRRFTSAIPISARIGAPIDVYVWCQNADGVVEVSL